MSNYQYYRPNLFPPVVKNLLIVNALIFVAQETIGVSNPNVIENWFALHDVRSVFFKPHQIITYMFLHGSFFHILSNMLGVWVFGSMLENHWGAKRFLQFYIICGIGAGLLHLGVLYIEMKPAWDYINTFPVEVQEQHIHDNLVVIQDILINQATLGASGAVFGCLAAAGYLFPNRLVMIYGIIPVKIMWLAIGYGAYELYVAIQNSAGDTIAHFAHLGGAITGIILVFIWNKTNRRTFY
jgi:membrane associated rhomboid family serine protease